MILDSIPGVTFWHFSPLCSPDPSPTSSEGDLLVSSTRTGSSIHWELSSGSISPSQIQRTPSSDGHNLLGPLARSRPSITILWTVILWTIILWSTPLTADPWVISFYLFNFFFLLFFSFSILNLSFFKNWPIKKTHKNQFHQI